MFNFGFILFQIFFSLLCSFFVLFHFLSDRTLRQALNNHIIIILLFIGLIYGIASVLLDTWKFTLSFAHFWTIIDYLHYSTRLVDFAWASIERHILIFHSHWISTKKKRFLVHYLLLITLMIYSFIYYLVIIIFPFCTEVIHQSPLNGVPMSCVLANSIFYKYNTISHQFLSVSLIIIMNIGLFPCVIWQTSRMNSTTHKRADQMGITAH